MATLVEIRGLEVPSISSMDSQISHTGSLRIPNFDDPSYESWAIRQIAWSNFCNYETRTGRVSSSIQKTLLNTFENQAEKMLHRKESDMMWGEVPAKKKKKKSITFFPDVQYKHDMETDEIIKGPVSSSLTYDPSSPAL